MDYALFNPLQVTRPHLCIFHTVNPAKLDSSPRWVITNSQSFIITVHTTQWDDTLSLHIVVVAFGVRKATFFLRIYINILLKIKNKRSTSISHPQCVSLNLRFYLSDRVTTPVRCPTHIDSSRRGLCARFVRN